MRCPVCDAQLRQVQKYNVEIDICPDCKGVWLDRGELEKILEMAETGGPRQEMAPSAERRVEREPQYRDDRERHHDDHSEKEFKRDHERGDYDPRTGKPKRRGSWLADIMDSFGGGGSD